MRQAVTLGVVVVVLLGSLSSCASEEKSSLAAFCAAVERAPKDDSSVAANLIAARDVESKAPQEIRAEVESIRRALEAFRSPDQMRALTDPGSPVHRDWQRYQDYVEERCY